MEPQQPQAYQNRPPKPVAYDAEGQPLYAAPVQPVQATQPPQAPPSEQAIQPQVQTQASVNTHSNQPMPSQETASLNTNDQSSSSHVTSQPSMQPGENYHPQIRAQYANEPKVNHVTRPYDMEPHEISEDLKSKHDKSARDHPNLNLSAAEYVILKIKRHPIGLWLPMGGTLAIIAILLTALISYPMIAADPVSGEVPGLVPLTVVLLCLITMVGIGGYVAIWVYLKNTFYLTNESVIQEIQHSLFSRHEQTVSLGSIEDASFKQKGILQSFLNYGTIRLSTEGEETTYKFQFVANPKQQIAKLNDAVEAFKNGRPVGD